MKPKRNGILAGALSSRLFSSLVKPLSSFRSGNRLGLIISEKEARLCLLKPNLSQVIIKKTADYYFNVGDSEDWPVRVSHLIEFIIGFLDEQGIKKIPINIGLLSHNICFRKMIIPKMPSSELSAAIEWEGGKLFPFDLEQCLINFEIVDRFTSNSGAKLAINAVAVRRNIIETIYDQFHTAGLTVGQVNFLPLNMIDLVNRQNPDKIGKDNIILYLDHDHSLAIFEQDGCLEFFQEFVIKPIDGPLENRSIQNIDEIGEELSSFIDLYIAQGNRQAISSILLCGKFGVNESTSEYIAERTGIPCHRLSTDGFRIKDSSDDDSALINEYIAPIMAGISATYLQPLVPEYLKIKKKNRPYYLRIALATALTLITVIGLQFSNHNTIGTLESEWNLLNSEITKIENSDQYHTYLAILGKLNRNQAREKLSEQMERTHFHLLLKELSLTIPEHLSLTLMNIQKEEDGYVLYMDGNVNIDQFAPEIILAQYVETLENSPFFKNVEVTSHEKKTRRSDFNLAFHLQMDISV